jgi:hypothetical protein
MWSAIVWSRALAVTVLPGVAETRTGFATGAAFFAAFLRAGAFFFAAVYYFAALRANLHSPL